MKSKMFALIALLFAGICHAQTVTITRSGQINNVNYVNTVIGQPCVIIAPNINVVFQQCSFTSVTDGIVVQAAGSGLTVLQCTGTCNPPPGYSPGSFIVATDPISILCNYSTITGWATPATIHGVTPSNNGVSISFGVDTIQNCGGPIFCYGVCDPAPNESLEFIGNTFSGFPNPAILVFVENANVNVVAGTVFVRQNVISGTLHGYVTECQGSFFEANLSGGSGGKNFYVGTVYGPPSLAGQ